MSKRAASDRCTAPKTLSGFFRGVESRNLLPQLVQMLRRVGADPLVIRWAEWWSAHRGSRPIESAVAAAELCDFLAGRSSQPAMDSLELRWELAQHIIIDERAHTFTLQVLKRMGVPSIDRLGAGQRRLFLTGLSMLLSDLPPESRSANAEASR